MKNLITVLLVGICLLSIGCEKPHSRWAELNQKIGEGGEIHKDIVWPYDIKGGWKVKTNYLTDGGLNQVIATNRNSEGVLVNARVMSGQPIPPGSEVVFTYLTYKIGASGGSIETIVAQVSTK
jgi:hypothetical protein